MSFTFAAQGQVDSLLNEAKLSSSDTAKLRNLILVTEYCDIPEIEIYAQQCISLADSLIQIGGFDETDLRFYKSTALNNLGFMHHAYGEYKEAIEQYQKCILIYREINDSLGLSRGLNNIAMVFKDEGDTDKAVEFLTEAYEICEPMGDYDLLNITLTNFGTIYTQIGDLDKAVAYLFKAIKLQEKHKDEYGLSHSYNTLASLYHSQEDYQKSKKYFELAVAQAKASNDYDVLGSCYNNLGFIHDVMNEDSLALEYYTRSLEIRIEINDPKGESECYSNLGSYYIEHGDTAKGVDFIHQALEIRKKLGEVGGLANTYQKLSGIYYTKGEVDKALEYGELSFEYSNQIGYNDDVKNSALILSQIYASKLRFKEAYEMHVLYLEKRDLLFNKKNQKNIIEQEVELAYTKKQLADSLNTAKTLEVAEIEKQYQQDKLDKANQRNWAMMIGMVLLILLVILALIGYRNKKKSEQTISKQKEMVEEKNREITDSINYAKRIQDAILPSRHSFLDNLKNGFVLYKPKDVVSGDFYWLEKVNDDIYFAAADCTGHGVPGALVSVVCSNALSKALLEEGIKEPGELLNRTRDLIIQRFAKSDEDVKDGMDISLCRLNGQKLAWAGANNPLWLVKSGADEITEIKANKQPVGLYTDPKPFETHYVDLDKGDTIFVFSDGYPDQFGGENGKKLKSVNFKKLLLANRQKQMDEIKNELDIFFEAWKADFEQVDDVCIIGVRV